jgi:hypothetical protein
MMTLKKSANGMFAPTINTGNFSRRETTPLGQGSMSQGSLLIDPKYCQKIIDDGGVTPASFGSVGLLAATVGVGEPAWDASRCSSCRSRR